MKPAIKLAAMLVSVAGTVMLTSAARSTTVAFQDRETARLRAHFDSVLAELRGASVASLDSAQRAARDVLVHRLEAYAAAGRFPHNHVRAGEMVPVFRDEHGTLCAMAFLIASTGRTDIVDAVARTRNLEYIPQLASDPRLTAWLDSVGLTVTEAARIQPSYGDGGCCVLGPDPRQPQPGASSNFYAARNSMLLASAGITAASGVTTWLNASPQGASPSRVRWTSTIGTLAGVAQLAYGASALRYDDARMNIGVGNLLVGAVSAGTAIWRMTHIPARQPGTVAAR